MKIPGTLYIANTLALINLILSVVNIISWIIFFINYYNTDVTSALPDEKALSFAIKNLLWQIFSIIGTILFFLGNKSGWWMLLIFVVASAIGSMLWLALLTHTPYTTYEFVTTILLLAFNLISLTYYLSKTVMKYFKIT